MENPKNLYEVIHICRQQMIDKWLEMDKHITEKTLMSLLSMEPFWRYDS